MIESEYLNRLLKLFKTTFNKETYNSLFNGDHYWIR